LGIFIFLNNTLGVEDIILCSNGGEKSL